MLGLTRLKKLVILTGKKNENLKIQIREKNDPFNWAEEIFSMKTEKKLYSV